MINPTLLILLFIGLAFWSCDDNQPENIPETNSIHFGTYLYEDEDCSGSDIQYATFDSEGITFFDYLGDNCDYYVGGSQGWIHQTEDGGFFMASGYAVTKLDQNCNVIWNAAAASGFDKYFSNGMVSGINHSMKPIENGAVMAGYGSSDWE